ncbi:selenide, water dikinase SelD [Lichenicoccus sp.]|uniref:selenide, water dikinase SelD n=1 Tax=Lichenicoccus sp. TaxID=2781899 RepID=UPI003D0A5846
MTETDVRLTALAHGGGCGCKLAPSVLQQILADMPLAGPFANLLVGTETGDDAAVYRLNDTQALVATTDFFMPVVDDPELFGRIAATNALSDIYAMGATPILALAILGMPLGRISIAAIRRIVAGGMATCAEAGIPVAGGHSIDSPEPIYGLVALGLVHPERLMRNSSAQAGDRLILTKGLGIGIYSAALKQGRLDPAGYQAMIASTTQRNDVGIALAGMPGMHAMTDVTGFGLLGHALELCRGSGLAATLRMTDVRLLHGAAGLARDGVRTGAGSRNWASYGEDVRLEPDIGEWQKDLLCDPQTSGGLLLAVAASAVDGVLALLRARNYRFASVIGEVAVGSPSVIVG